MEGGRGLGKGREITGRMKMKEEDEEDREM